MPLLGTDLVSFWYLCQKFVLTIVSRISCFLSMFEKKSKQVFGAVARDRNEDRI